MRISPDGFDTFSEASEAQGEFVCGTCRADLKIYAENGRFVLRCVRHPYHMRGMQSREATQG